MIITAININIVIINIMKNVKKFLILKCIALYLILLDLLIIDKIELA